MTVRTIVASRPILLLPTARIRPAKNILFNSVGQGYQSQGNIHHVAIILAPFNIARMITEDGLFIPSNVNMDAHIVIVVSAISRS